MRCAESLTFPSGDANMPAGEKKHALGLNCCAMPRSERAGEVSGENLFMVSNALEAGDDHVI